MSRSRSLSLTPAVCVGLLILQTVPGVASEGPKLGSASDPSAESGASTGTVSIELEGRVDVNGQALVIDSTGSYDPLTGAYVFDSVAPAGAVLGEREKLLLSLFPRIALAFVGAEGRIDLLGRSGAGGVTASFTARRKVDEVSSVAGTLTVSTTQAGWVIDYGGSVVSTPDRPIESDGEAVVRLGVNPSDGTFVGGARINYDAGAPDPASLGTADFWNVAGSFSGAAGTTTEAYAHVDHAGGNPASALAQGAVLSFPASTVQIAGIITLSGTATSDGTIHQFLGFADQAGGGRTVLDFPIQVTAGMKANEVASRIAAAFNQARTAGTSPEAAYVLAVQGGDGVSVTTPDPSSPQVAVSITMDGGATIADPSDPAAASVFSTVSTQNFSDQLVVASENSGIRNQFGVLGSGSLSGWLTPFKAVLTTDNPATGFAAGGGKVSFLLNWSDAVPGGSRGGQPGSQTSFSDLEITTSPGETAEQIVARLTDALKGQVTSWGSHAFFQRDGNVLYIDAGIDAPHSVSIASSDPGVGYMSAAADLPQYQEPGS